MENSLDTIQQALVTAVVDTIFSPAQTFQVPNQYGGFQSITIGGQGSSLIAEIMKQIDIPALAEMVAPKAINDKAIIKDIKKSIEDAVNVKVKEYLKTKLEGYGYNNINEITGELIHETVKSRIEAAANGNTKLSERINEMIANVDEYDIRISITATPKKD